MSNDLDLTIEEVITRIVTIKVEQRLDLSRAQEFRAQVQKLLDEGVIRFVIDLEDTPFLDSAGIAALVSILKQSRQRNGDVRLVAPKSEAVKRIFELTKFDRVFEIKSSVSAAIASFHG